MKTSDSRLQLLQWAELILIAFLSVVRAVAAPENDPFVEAQAITALPVEVAGSTIDATAGENEGDDASVWYRIESANAGEFDIQVLYDSSQSPAGFQWELLILSDAGALTAIDNSGTWDPEHLPTQIDLGTAYWVRVWSRGAPGDFSLSITESIPPPNDNFVDAIEIETRVLPVVIEGTTVRCTGEAEEPNHGADYWSGCGAIPFTRSVWFTFEFPNDTWVAPTLLTMDPFSYVIVYQGEQISALKRISTGQDFLAKTETRYYVAILARGLCTLDTVDNFSGERYAFTLSESSPPGNQLANDHVENAIVITQPGNSVEISGTTVGASVEPGEPIPDNNLPNFPGSVWYRWTAPASGIAEAAATAFNPDFGVDLEIDSVSVYTGSSIDSLKQVSFPDPDPLDPFSPPFSGKFIAHAGESYAIRIGSDYYTGGSPFDLRVTLEEAELFSDWQNATFSDAQLAANLGDPGKNPDGDNDTNLVEYALGRNPLIQAFAPPLRTLVMRDGPGGSDKVTFEIASDVRRPDVNYLIERSTDLIQWSSELWASGSYARLRLEMR